MSKPTPTQNKVTVFVLEHEEYFTERFKKRNRNTIVCLMKEDYTYYEEYKTVDAMKTRFPKTSTKMLELAMEMVETQAKDQVCIILTDKSNEFYFARITI